MRSAFRLLLVLALTLPAAILASSAQAAGSAQPPNPNDPCISGGQDSCGSTGIGFYKTYRYGVRWFGDYRNVVAGETHSFCIDLRFWYPSATDAYRVLSVQSGLRNRAGQAVALTNQEEMAYAVYSAGQTSDANRQAAVMLYVHSRMGDAAPGEVDPSALGAAVVAQYAAVARDAAKYHGPYKIVTTIPGGIVGSKVTATIRVLAASGAAVPNVPLTLTATGATGVPAQITTNASGVAQVSLTSTSTDGVSLTAKSGLLASTLPKVFQASKHPAATNAQRLVVADTQVVQATASVTPTKAKIAVTTAATPGKTVLGQPSRDKVTITGATAGWTGSVKISAFGPYPTAAAATCTGAPVFSASYDAAGPIGFLTPPATFAAPGWYAYQEVVPGDDDNTGLTTACGTASEMVQIQVAPTLGTQVNAQVVAPGASLVDHVAVAGLAGQPVTVTAALYGPFASATATSCTGTPAWTGTIPVTVDGTYDTAPVQVTVPGYYTYQEGIAESDTVKGVATACADVAETSVVTGTPVVHTVISSQDTAPGDTITDKVSVSGLGALELPVTVQLFGPFTSVASIDCTGTPVWTGSLTAKGDGDYTTAPVKLTQAGYYTYHESIAAGPASSAAETTCADTAETTFTHATPTVGTIASDEVVHPGSTITDRIKVAGLGSTPAQIEVQLFGPFASRTAIGCGGTPISSTKVMAKGDGVVTSEPVKLATVGFYTFREHLVGSPVVDSVTTDCAVAAETSLAAPLIITGRGDVAHQQIRTAGAGSTPRRVQIASRGISATVLPVGIDMKQGVLGVPENIQHTGWWKDGQAPGATTGAVLIAGHVDSAAAGAGAFFHLAEARKGDIVTVTVADGKTFRYRVVSTRRMLKANLPLNVYSQAGPARLVLVTCGGPFDQTIHRYRDNIVVTAVPA